MRLLTVENQRVDLIKVQQRLLGNYSQLQIDMCGIIDRSAPAETHLTELGLNHFIPSLSLTLRCTDTDAEILTAVLLG